ncbi:glycosyl hydrolase 108 family protein [Xanthomonas sp. WHRI 1810A]|uniref:glycoside hydrolase family 108 protein n=1 Tax=Xanthomonas sp. WHRI 1810A TaxID=3161565 RepID=UPI0032E91A47
MTGFDLAFERVVGHEGGFSTDPKDRGNWTTGVIGQGLLNGSKFGISAMSYPDIHIKHLMIDQAKAIYKRDFWDRAKADQYDQAISYQLFDIAVNNGNGNAIRMLQRAASVVDDGQIGPESIAAVKRMSVTDVIMRLNAERLLFITKLSTWPTYGKGWSNRVAGNLQYGAVDA